MRPLTFTERRQLKLAGILDSLLTFKTETESIYEVIRDLRREGEVASNDFDDLVQLQYGKPESPDDFEYLFCQVLTAYFLVKVLYVRDRERHGKALTLQGEHAVALLKNTQAILKEFVPEFEVSDWASKTFLTYQPAAAPVVVDNLEVVNGEVARKIAQLMRLLAPRTESLQLMVEVDEALRYAPGSLRNLAAVDRALYRRARKFMIDTHALAVRFAKTAAETTSVRNESLITLRDIVRTYALNASLAFKLISLNASLAVASGEAAAARQRNADKTPTPEVA